MMVLGQEPRQTTSNLGHLQKPSVQVRYEKEKTISYLNAQLIDILLFSGPNSRVKSTLLFYQHKLQKK